MKDGEDEVKQEEIKQEEPKQLTQDEASLLDAEVETETKQFEGFKDWDDKKLLETIQANKADIGTRYSRMMQDNGIKVYRLLCAVAHIWSRLAERDPSTKHEDEAPRNNRDLAERLIKLFIKHSGLHDKAESSEYLDKLFSQWLDIAKCLLLRGEITHSSGTEQVPEVKAGSLLHELLFVLAAVPLSANWEPLSLKTTLSLTVHKPSARIYPWIRAT